MNIYNYLILLSVSLLNTGCLDGDITSPKAGPDQHAQVVEARSYSSEELIDKLVQMGFKKEDIEEMADYFLVEGDIGFNKSELIKGSYDAPKTIGLAKASNNRYGGMVSTGLYPIIKVGIDVQSFTDNQILQFVQRNLPLAIAELNAVPSSITYSISESSADITISMWSKSYFKGEFPANGRPGRKVHIANKNYFPGVDIKVKAILMHELQHCIGIAHSHHFWGWDGYIVGTRQVDPFSNMHYAITSDYLSHSDKYALSLLYPSWIRKIDVNYNGINELIYFGISPPRVDIFPDGNTARRIKFLPSAGYSLGSDIYGRDFLSGKWYNSGGEGFAHIVPGTNYIHLWQGKSDYTFNVGLYKPWDGYVMNDGSYWRAGDWNNDGVTDLIHFLGYSFNIWMNNGNGTFTISNHGGPWSGFVFGYDNRYYNVIEKENSGDELYFYSGPGEIYYRFNPNWDTNPSAPNPFTIILRRGA